MTELQKLREKLCRELAQSEHAAIVQPRREARRLGDVPPATALRAIADHAAAMKPRFDSVIPERRASRRGVAIGRGVGEMFSTLRNVVFDRIIDAERSYRGTLLGVSHGIDLVRMLRAVADRENDQALLELCHDWLTTRLALIAHAQDRLDWFVEQPAFALS